MGAIQEARQLVQDEIGDRKLLAELPGANILGTGKYLAVTSEAVYIAAVGLITGMPFGRQVKRYPITKITSVTVEKGLLACTIQIATGEGVSEEDMVTLSNKHYKKAGKVAGLILEVKRRRQRAAQQQLQAVEPIPAQIKQLADLKDLGIISVEEFEGKKRELLSRM